MTFTRPFATATVGVILAMAVSGCGQNATSGAGATGGASGSAGPTGGGGGSSSGGSSATGGNAGPGGSTSSTSLGGASGTGGAGSAGSTGSGGATSFGGNVGSGGATGGGGAVGGGGVAGGKTGTPGGAGGGGAAGGAAGGGGAAGAGGGGPAGGSTGAGGGTGPTVDCADTSTSTLSFTKQYDGGSITTGSTKTYYTQTNWWHKFGGQTVNLTGLSMKIGNSSGTSVPASDGNPMGFPSIYIGAYSGHETVGSNLPKQVSAIKSVPTIFQTNASSLDTSNFNATYDVWFTASGGKLTSAMQNNPGTGGAYLMVWMYKPADRQPRGGNIDAQGVGTPNYAAQTVPGMPGTWDVWVDSKSDPLCISYVSSTPTDGLAFDLNNFIQDSVTKKYGITSSMYLNLVFGGFEIWSGGDGLQLKQFCAAVN